MAKHDIVLLNTTSSGFETDLGTNVARIKGTADDLFSVRDSSGTSKFAVSSLDDSMIISGSLTLTGNLSSSLSSTASFGRIDVTNLVGDASQMTNTNQIGHVSSSAQLASRISGAFTAGFELDGENRLISGSATSTGSFTRVFANVYSGDASDMFNTVETGHLSSSAQIASNISGSFTSGFELSVSSEISGSATSTGSFGKVNVGSQISADASQVTGVANALTAGTVSGSAQLATSISGSFTKGFEFSGEISGSSTSTGSFGLYKFGAGGIVITDVSGLTGIPSSEGFISSSAQLASNISGSFNKGFGHSGKISGSVTSTGSFGKVDVNSQISADASQVSGLTLTGVISSSAQLASNISASFQGGFEFTGKISGSATSTGSFKRLNFNSLSVSTSSAVTNHESGHISSSAQLASNISASFQGGFGFSGTISGSTPSNLIIHNLNLGGTTTFGETNLVKNWSTSLIRSATYGDSLASAISGAFNAGFHFIGEISGSTTSTGSFNKIESQELFVKEMVGVRKPISGSMNHDNYISASYKTDSHGRINIPTFGRGHTVNTQQFSATSSMEDQTYRAQAGQLFVDNFGRLNMTVQTGSMVAVAGTWEAGPTGLLNEGPGGAAATGTPNAIIQSAPWHIYSGSAIYDGISWTRVSDVTSVHGSTVANCSIGTVDAALFLRHSGGSTSGTNTGKYGSFPNVPAHATFQEDWDGVGWTRGPSDAGTFVKRSGTGGKVGSVNSHIAFNGDDYPTLVGTADWNGVTWQSVGPHTPTARDSGGGFGGVYDGVVAGGASPNNTCVDEWNGTTWSTATALPTGQSGAGGAGPQTAGIIMGGSPAKEVQEYNGSTWSEGTSIPVNFSSHATGGSSGKAFAISIASTYFWTGGFVTGSADTHNYFTQNTTGRYLLTKKLQANYSPGCAGGGSTSSEEDFGGGY